MDICGRMTTYKEGNEGLQRCCVSECTSKYRPEQGGRGVPQPGCAHIFPLFLNLVLWRNLYLRSYEHIERKETMDANAVKSPNALPNTILSRGEGSGVPQPVCAHIFPLFLKIVLWRNRYLRSYEHIEGKETKDANAVESPNALSNTALSRGGGVPVQGCAHIFPLLTVYIWCRAAEGRAGHRWGQYFCGGLHLGVLACGSLLAGRHSRHHHRLPHAAGKPDAAFIAGTTHYC
jgi:hypothetical protein